MQEGKFIEYFDDINIYFKVKKNIIYIRGYDMFNLLYYLKGKDFLDNHKKIIKEEIKNNMIDEIDNIIEFEQESLNFFKDLYISLNSFIKNINVLNLKEKNKVYIWFLKILLKHIDNFEINLNYDCKENNSKLNVDINLM